MASEQPWGQQAATYHAREDRRMLSRLYGQAGVVGQADLKVTTGGSGLQAAVAAGDAFVLGTHAGVTRQGLYPVFESGTSVTLTAADATNPRIDQVVLRVRDTEPAAGVAGDGSSAAIVEVVTGTATSGATLANRTGATALPASSLRLADILVPAAFTGPFVNATHIRDRRPWARGARYMGPFNVYPTATSSAPTAGSYIDIPNGPPTVRLEHGGPDNLNRLVMAWARLSVQRNTAGQGSVSLAMNLNGTDYQIDADYIDNATGASLLTGSIYFWLPTGTHTYKPRVFVSTSATNIYANSLNWGIIEEPGGWDQDISNSGA